MSRLEDLLAKQAKLEEAIKDETAKSEAEAVLNKLGGNVAKVVTAEAVKASVDIAVLHGKFFALTVADGTLAVTVAAKAVRKASNGGHGGNGGNGGNGNGTHEYFLKDGRGPFADIQAAMTEMGVAEANRPKHNRYDRLFADWQSKIDRRPKAETPAETAPAADPAS